MEITACENTHTRTHIHTHTHTHTHQSVHSHEGGGTRPHQHRLTKHVHTRRQDSLRDGEKGEKGEKREGEKGERKGREEEGEERREHVSVRKYVSVCVYAKRESEEPASCVEVRDSCSCRGGRGRIVPHP